VDKASGDTIPDSSVKLIRDNGGGTTLLVVTHGTVKDAGIPGNVRIESAQLPSLFQPVKAVLKRGENLLQVTALVRVVVSYFDSSERAVSPELYDVELKRVDKASIEKCVAEGRGQGEKVNSLLGGVAGEAIASGDLVPAGAGAFILAVGRHVALVTPSHPAFYGESSSQGGSAPRVTGVVCPLSSEIRGGAGETVELRVTVGRTGVVEIDMGGWSEGLRSGVVLRRAGRAGRESLSRSWKMMSSRNLGSNEIATETRLTFADLLPGTYKIDAWHQETEGALCVSLLFALVDESRTTYLRVANGIGNGSFVVRKEAGIGRGNGTLFCRVPAPPQLSDDMPEWAHTVTIPQWTAGEVLVSGLQGQIGNLTFVSGTGALSCDLRLAERRDYVLR
jgi:hypothetical protein